MNIRIILLEYPDVCLCALQKDPDNRWNYMTDQKEFKTNLKP